jgi:hypothetical protein
MPLAMNAQAAGERYEVRLAGILATCRRGGSYHFSAENLNTVVLL